MYFSGASSNCSVIICLPPSSSSYSFSFFALLCSSLVISDFEKYRISAPLLGVTSDYFSEEGGHDRGETLSLSPLSLPLSSSPLSSLSRVYKERSLVTRGSCPVFLSPFLAFFFSFEYTYSHLPLFLL